MSFEQLLGGLKSGDKERQIRALLELDASGLFINEGESAADFSLRLAKLNDTLCEIKEGKSRYDSEYLGFDKVDAKLISEASAITWRLYRFRAEWVPVRVSKKNTGPFCEGILYEFDGYLPAIFLKNPNKKNSAEILAHEMCHAAKLPFAESVYCEYFPRKTEENAFRQLAGNLFRKWQIPCAIFASLSLWALLIALGKIALALIALIPAILAFAREIYISQKLKKARAKLELANFEALPILFRMTDSEIFELANAKDANAWISDMSARSIRWEVYKAAFSKSGAKVRE